MLVCGHTGISSQRIHFPVDCKLPVHLTLEIALKWHCINSHNNRITARCRHLDQNLYDDFCPSCSCSSTKGRVRCSYSTVDACNELSIRLERWRSGTDFKAFCGYKPRNVYRRGRLFEYPPPALSLLRMRTVHKGLRLRLRSTLAMTIFPNESTGRSRMFGPLTVKHVVS